MPLDLDVIQARAEKATLGPWHYWIEDADHLSEMPWGIRTSNGHSVLARQMPPDDKDGAFIAAARTDIPALVAELQAARECVARVRAHVLNDEIYCARCIEDLNAYETVAGLPVTVPEATRTHAEETPDAGAV